MRQWVFFFSYLLILWLEFNHYQEIFFYKKTNVQKSSQEESYQVLALILASLPSIYNDPLKGIVHPIRKGRPFSTHHCAAAALETFSNLRVFWSCGVWLSHFNDATHIFVSLFYVVFFFFVFSLVWILTLRETSEWFRRLGNVTGASTVKVMSGEGEKNGWHLKSGANCPFKPGPQTGVVPPWRRWTKPELWPLPSVHADKRSEDGSLTLHMDRLPWCCSANIPQLLVLLSWK